MSLFQRIIDFLVQPIPSLPRQDDYDVRARQDHLPECDPTNCDISGEEWMVRRFVEQVRQTLAEGRICILYSAAFLPGTADSTKIWPGITEQSFREAVLDQLPEGQFNGPDDLDEDWQFVHYPVHGHHVGDAFSRGPLGLD